ncbi:MAG: hypothetical protein WKF31_03785 [Thermoleophilaceae bacterium]
MVSARPHAARTLARPLTALAILVALTGCGSSPPSELPVPEPAASPAPREEPAGRVVDVGNAPGGRGGGPGDRDRRARLPQSEPARARRRSHRRDGARGAPALLPRHLGLAGPGGPVLVPTEAGGSLVQVSLPEGKVLSTTRVGRTPHDADAAGGRIFVGNEFDDSVSVLEDGRELKRLPAARQPGGVAGTDVAVGVVSVTGRVFEAFDARTLRSLGRVSGGVGPTHVVAEPEGCYYVADTQGDAVLLLRRRGPGSSRCGA